MDDEFAKDVSEFDTLEAFRNDLREKLVERRTQQNQNNFEEAIRDQLIANMECEVPDGMVEVQLDRLMDDYAMRLQSQGIPMDDYMKMMGMDVATLRASAKPTALRQVQMELALNAVVEAEKIEVTDEMIEAEFAKLAEQYNLSVEQVKAAVAAEDLKRDMLLQKANELVIAEAKVGEVPVKEDAPKKKRATKKETTAEAGEEAPAKPKRTRKKKTEETEEPKAE